MLTIEIKLIPTAVLKADFKSICFNKIIVSKKDNLLSTSCKLSNLNWMYKISLPLDCKVRIRYNSKGADAKLYKKNDLYYCNFLEPQLAVTPGQSIVFYDNDTIIGGGIIEE